MNAAGALHADTEWRTLTGADVEGKGWRETAAPFDRMPPRAEATVPPEVWRLSRMSAGLALRFLTDAPRVSVRWSLTGANLAMPHMAATGVSGVDLYVRRRERDRAWRFAGVGQPRAQENNVADFAAAAPGESPAADGRETRECLLYLPLYTGVSEVAVGVPAGHQILPAPPYPEKRRRPVVFYGTSITQGACASRPGMAFVAQVGRRLGVPTVNLGFSGSGKMEPALADLLCTLDETPAVIVLDCLRNMSEAQVAERFAPFVRRLRARWPDVPVLAAEDAFLHNPPETPRGRLVRDALGTDGEGTVDLIHPNDLGMTRLADAFAKGLAGITRT